MPALWKTKYLRNAKAADAYIRSPRALDLVEEIIRECGLHLRETSLEHLVGTPDLTPHNVDVESLLLPPSPLHDELKMVFLTEFVAHNTCTIMDGNPNPNELIFLALCAAWYVTRARRTWWRHEVKLRGESVATTGQRLIDCRLKLARLMSYKHWHVVDRKHYVDREERAEVTQKNRLDAKNPHMFDAITWAQMKAAEEDRVQQEEWRKTEAQAYITSMQAKYVRAMKKGYAFHDNPVYEDEKQAVSETPPKSTWPAPLQFPTDHEWTSLMDEISFVLTFYPSTSRMWAVAVAHAMKTHKDEFDLPGPTWQPIVDEYTNETTLGQQGWLWRLDVESFPMTILPCASQAMSQIWTEQHWLHRYPIVDVELSPQSIEQCHQWMRQRMQLEIDDAVTQEMRFTVFDSMIPMAARTISSRVHNSKGTDPRTICYKMLSTNVTENVAELFEEESAVRLIGYNPSHPLYDCLFMALVQIEAYADGKGGFSLREQCSIPSSDLVKRGHVLEWSHEKTGQPRRPRIVQLQDQWYVHRAQGQWWRATNGSGFLEAFCLWLEVMAQDFEYEMEDKENIEYWHVPERYLGPRVPVFIV